MLRATNSDWFKRIFALYNEHYLLRRHFHSIRMRGWPDIVDGRPVLYIMNHSSWWDGLLVYHAVRRYSRHAHFILMEERQLRTFAFFRKLGAFPIDRDRPAAMAATFRYALRLLSEGNPVWIFPQGEIRHAEERPIRFREGAALLLERMNETVVVPVTAYYAMALHQRPDASLWFGPPIELDWRTMGRAAATELLRTVVEAQLDAHREQAIAHPDGELRDFVPIMRSGRSTSVRYESWRRRLKSGWRSFFGS
ncbi:lysophospholipid acyltransferase family protein [Paenibacillus methanolicus]|uniref:1-acyl-sn-glycerol-3-phosphate acyltransferase n=1 Tax=Paenibacillus methanolicus TaxID=582686 RepID=A0A5S5CKV2_9BACL|nr:lysophospholipid acyltransferase family protein [Paenibacillus methanolicus]TYP79507.1 1-acyl-sn-glycerol-3-phosphate acyltransferase [Paenibacillus methanolicus]